MNAHIKKTFMFLFFILTIKSNSTTDPVMTLTSLDGDIIDCVHIRDQPAFKHPALFDHDLQEAPATLPTPKNRVRQMWNLNGSSCPDHTVPILRNKMGTKGYRKRHFTDVRNRVRTMPYPFEEGHEYVIAYPETPMDVYGTQATMNVWGPSVEPGENEFSVSQIWLFAGHHNESDLNSIEAGWQVFPNHYNDYDHQPRLFVYWTADSYHTTGCLNLECPGFVQVNKDFLLGGAFAPISTLDGVQYDVKMTIWKDMGDGNWWLGIGESFVGYWPAKLFTHLEHGPATMVQWGGEVVNTRTDGQHTKTQMGAGCFAEEGYGKASYFHTLRIIDLQYRLLEVQEFILESGNSACYNAKKDYTKEWGTFFYYGGPGYNALCP